MKQQIVNKEDQYIYIRHVTPPPVDIMYRHHVAEMTKLANHLSITLDSLKADTDITYMFVRNDVTIQHAKKSFDHTESDTVNVLTEFDVASLGSNSLPILSGQHFTADGLLHSVMLPTPSFPDEFLPQKQQWQSLDLGHDVEAKTKRAMGADVLLQQ